MTLVAFVPVGVGCIAPAWTPAAALGALRARSRVIRTRSSSMASPVSVCRRTRGTMLARRCRCTLLTRRTAIFLRQIDADQLFNVPHVSVFLAGAERDRDAVGAGTRCPSDAMDIRLRNIRD